MKKVLILPVLIFFSLILASCASLAHPAFSPIPAARIVPAASTASPPSVPVDSSVDQQVIGEFALVASDGDFRTPGDAIRYFADCLKRNDFLDAARSFPVHVFQGAAYSDRPRIVYMTTGYLPSEYQELNLAQAALVYKSALLSVCGYDPTAQTPTSPADTVAFLEAISPSRLSAMTVSMVDMVSTLSEDMASKYRVNLAAQAKAYGADECRIYQVVLALDERKAAAALTMLRYGYNWYIASGTFMPGN